MPQLFAQHVQNMVYTFAHNAALEFKGDRQALKTISSLLVTHAMDAGVLVLPKVGMLLAAASMIGSLDDEPWDAVSALRNDKADAFGEKVVEVLHARLFKDSAEQLNNVSPSGSSRP